MINQKRFRFGILSRQLESDKHRIWLKEAELAALPNLNPPEIHRLTIDDFDLTQKQKNIADTLPRAYNDLFDALREKRYNEGSIAQRVQTFLRGTRCFKNCFRKGVSNPDHSLLTKDTFPSFLSTYHLIDY